MRPESQKILQNIGTYVGAFFGVMGMVIAIAASPLFGSIFSLIFIVVFGLAFGLPYLRKRKSKQLLKTGIQANGKIVEMWDTGWTMNNQPQIGLKIEVTPQAGNPFTAETQMVISRLQTAYYQAGVDCIVRYDPNNKKTVAIESLGGSLGNNSDTSKYNGSFLDQFDSFYASQNHQPNQPKQKENPYFPGKSSEQIELYLIDMDTESKRIVSIGIESSAIIKTTEFVNVYDSGTNEFYLLRVAVMPENEPAFDAKCYALISPASIPKFQPGCQIWIKFDPKDRSKIAISHS